MGGILAADLNGDNSMDVLFTDYSYGENVGVLLNQRGTVMGSKSSPDPSTFGEAVTFTATVAASVKGVSTAPTGTVGFKDRKTLLAVVPLSHGHASYTTSALSAGVHQIVAVYSGDANFNPNQAEPLVQKVTQ